MSAPSLTLMNVGDYKVAGAVLLSGLFAGSATFGSATSVRMMFAATRNKDEELLNRFEDYEAATVVN